MSGGRLTITLIEGKDLIVGDINGKSDPYCLVRLSGGGPVLRGRTKKRTLNPKWNETLTLWYTDRRTECLYIRCMDEDRIGADDPLGDLSIPLADAAEGAKWYPLEHVKHGQLCLALSLEAESQEEETLVRPMGDWLACDPISASQAQQQQQQAGRSASCRGEAWNVLSPVPSENRYVVHQSTLAGVATTSAHELYRQFSCYEVEVHQVADVFGAVTSKWNEQYDKARKIFGPGAGTAVVRGALHAQHSELYKKGLRAWKSGGGTLVTGSDFLGLINYGVRDRIPVVFTYVLLERSLHFSETGTTFTKDFMSKHAMHANAAREVRYAGEFIVRKHALVIDNNSGTYAPDPRHLPLLEEVLRRNFPGLQVHAVDRDDKKLAEYKEEIKEEQERAQLQHAQCLVS